MNKSTIQGDELIDHLNRVQDCIGEPERSVTVEGLRGAASAYFLSRLHHLEKGQPILVVTTDQLRGELLLEDLKYFFHYANLKTKPLFFPSWELLPYESLSPLSEISGERLEILNRLRNGENLFLIAPVEALMQTVIPRSSLEKNVFLKGFLNVEEIRTKYKEYHLGIQPSLSEALSNSVLDFSHHNVPVVISNAGGMSEIIEDGIEVIPWVKKHNPSLLLLDLMLPNLNGKEICKEIRTFSKVPIIMVTAMIDEVDRLIGLELEADDYICKPFSPKEVVARVKTVLRRSDPNYNDSKASEGFEVNIENYSITLDGLKLDLTPVEFRILSMFINYPGRVYNRDQILNIIFEDGRIVLDRTVDTHIKNLRKKLYDIQPDKEFIRSVYGIGYSFEII